MTVDKQGLEAAPDSQLDRDAWDLAQLVGHFGLDAVDLDMLKRGDMLGSTGGKVFAALQSAYLNAASTAVEMDVVAWRTWLVLSNKWQFTPHATVEGEPLVTLSQAQSALAAMRAERDEVAALAGKTIAAANEAVAAAESQVLRLTEENEALRRERTSLIETKREQIERLEISRGAASKVALEAIARAEAAEARIKALEEALSHALDHYDRNTCLHESVHRGGSIWTICDDCGRQWADDKGGFQPHVDPTEISAARSTLKENAP